MRTIQEVFEDHGFWLDEAESDDNCVGYSRYESIAGAIGEVYSFGVLDKDGVQVYSTHERFGELAKGQFEGCEADGQAHLTVATPADADALTIALDQLDEAARTFFRLRTSLKQ